MNDGVAQTLGLPKVGRSWDFINITIHLDGNWLELIDPIGAWTPERGGDLKLMHLVTSDLFPFSADFLHHTRRHRKLGGAGINNSWILEVICVHRFRVVVHVLTFGGPCTKNILIVLMSIKPILAVHNL